MADAVLAAYIQWLYDTGAPISTGSLTRRRSTASTQSQGTLEERLGLTETLGSFGTRQVRVPMPVPVLLALAVTAWSWGWQ